MTASTAHPAVAPVIAALDALTDYQPTSAADLADVLRSVHNGTGTNLIDALATALRAFGNKSGAEQVYELLHYAADKLSGVGSDEIDDARDATGYWNAPVVTDSHL